MLSVQIPSTEFEWRKKQIKLNTRIAIDIDWIEFVVQKL